MKGSSLTQVVEVGRLGEFRWPCQSRTRDSGSPDVVTDLNQQVVASGGPQIRRTLARSTAASILAVLVWGCSGGNPVVPSGPAPATREVVPTPPPPPTPAPPFNPSSALVTIESPFAYVRRNGFQFIYEVRFLLRETGSKSGALVESVVLYSPAGSDATSSGCWRDPLRVAPNGVLDTFYTDAGATWLSYCNLVGGGTTTTPELYVMVWFRDDDNVMGSVAAAIQTLRLVDDAP